MLCPKCGEKMSWREPVCPKCGAVNPTQQKEKEKKKKDRVPKLVLLGAALLLVLLIILAFKSCGKGDKTPDRSMTAALTGEQSGTEPKGGAAQTPAPQETGKPDPSTEPGETKDPASYGSPEAYAASSACACFMAEQQTWGNGKPAAWVLLDINSDGFQELLITSGEVEGRKDTLIFTSDLQFSALVTSYGDICYDPDEQAIAYRPNTPMGSLEDGGYCDGHTYYKFHGASGSLYPLYSIGVDEGVALKDNGGITQTITVEQWQEAVAKLQELAWKPL